MSYIVTYKRVERSQELIFFPFLFALVKLLFPSMSLYQESDPVCERFFSFFWDRAKPSQWHGALSEIEKTVHLIFDILKTDFRSQGIYLSA